MVETCTSLNICHTRTHIDDKREGERERGSGQKRKEGNRGTSDETARYSV